MYIKLNQKCKKHGIFLLIFAITVILSNPVFAGENDDDVIRTLFKAAQEAGAKKDFAALAELVAPSERPMMAFGADFGVSMFVEFYEGPKAEELKKKYQQVQAKFKIKEEIEGDKLEITQDTPQEVIDAHVRKRAENKYKDVDLVKYIPELMAIILNMPEMAEQAFFPQEELIDLKVEADHATAKAGEESISFVREDDRWYLTGDIIE
jgi:hypothetical protein